MQDNRRNKTIVENKNWRKHHVRPLRAKDLRGLISPLRVLYRKFMGVSLTLLNLKPLSSRRIGSAGLWWGLAPVSMSAQAV